MYSLRMFTRPYNLGMGWKMFVAWQLHKNMTEKEIIVWYYPSCKEYVDSLFKDGSGTKDKPIHLPGFEVYFDRIK